MANKPASGGTTKSAGRPAKNATQKGTAAGMGGTTAKNAKRPATKKAPATSGGRAKKT